MPPETENPPTAPAHAPENHLIAERREKLRALRESGAAAFPNDFQPADRASALHAAHGEKSAGLLAQEAVEVSLGGRMVLKRVMGKASFATLENAALGADAGARMQLYIARDVVGEALYAAFRHWDLGDIIAAQGTLMKTQTGELSVKVHTLRLMAKSLRPMPDKFHGVQDHELKYRQRYVDLMVDAPARARFMQRTRLVAALRAWLVARDFIEVETPMLHPIPGGANARPFVTEHHALGQRMYLRIAPELYLKRLIVGGFERVFEINRNFRNEGISLRHNPEFTMLEFYAAWWNYRDVMDCTERLVRDAAQHTAGSLQLTYGARALDLAQPFARLTLPQAIAQYSEAGEQHAADRAWLTAALQRLDPKEHAAPALQACSLSALQVRYFEAVVEEKLWQPTFIMEHPTEISPLARANDARPDVAERFELYITGREIANGFSELNDAQIQAERFAAQVQAKERGDVEAMYFDHDFVRALECGMPPAGGCGIGIDRLMMLLGDSASIRDVILFPALRHEAGH